MADQSCKVIPRMMSPALESMNLGHLADLEYNKLYHELHSRLAFEPEFRQPDPKASGTPRTWGGRIMKSNILDRLVPVENNRAEHFRQAVHVTFPSRSTVGSYSLPPSCKQAITYMLTNSKSLPGWRDNQTQFLADFASRCLRYDKLIRCALLTHSGPLPEHIRTLEERKRHINLGLLCLLVDVLQWPDRSIVNDFMHGFPIMGEIPPTGVHRPQEPECSSSELASRLSETMSSNRAHLTTVTARISAQFKRAQHDPKLLHSLKETWRVTEEEIRDQWMSPLLTESDILKKFAGPPETPLRARVIRRFGIVQGQKEKLLPDGTKILIDKVRCIDDCKASKHNFCQRTSETINTCGYDYISHVAREIHLQCSIHNFSLPLGLQFGTDDIKSAYRQVPSASPEHTTVGFWCFDEAHWGVRYSTVYGLNFGHHSAVLAFNRVPELICYAARAIFAVPCEHYFDDYNTPSFCLPSRSRKGMRPGGCGGQACLFLLHELVGIKLDLNKHVSLDFSNVFLGVDCDSSLAFDLNNPQIQYSPKSGRVQSILHILEYCESANFMSPHEAQVLLGKLNFTIQSGVFGGCGRAASQPFYARAYPDSYNHTTVSPISNFQNADSSFTDQMKSSSAFYKVLFQHLPPNRFYLRRSKRGHVVVYSDAQFRKNRQGLGIFIYDTDSPTNPIFISGSTVPANLMDWFRSYGDRKTQINGLEILAALAAILTFPELFENREVLFFLDNLTALKVTVNGFNRHLDLACLSNAIHLALAGLSSRVYFDWVPGAANPADLPSRADFLLDYSSDPPIWRLDTSEFTTQEREYLLDFHPSVLQNSSHPPMSRNHIFPPYTPIFRPIVLPSPHQLDDLTFWITFHK